MGKYEEWLEELSQRNKEEKDNKAKALDRGVCIKCSGGSLEHNVRRYHPERIATVCRDCHTEQVTDLEQGRQQTARLEVLTAAGAIKRHSEQEVRERRRDSRLSGEEKAACLGGADC